MEKRLLLLAWLVSFASGFGSASPKASRRSRGAGIPQIQQHDKNSKNRPLKSPLATHTDGALRHATKTFHDTTHDSADTTFENTWRMIPFATVVLATTTASFPAPAVAAAAAAPIPSALWAYAHFCSILVITACLTAERLLVQPNMSTEDEDTIVKLDLVYGLMAALLIVSGFARATNFGKGGDFYIHEILFWVKMTVSGIWGGLSLFPSLTFYKRNFARKNSNNNNNNEDVVPPPPLSPKLASRLHQVINAEISAILTIPILATLMARGVLYSPDFPYQVGLVVSIAATGGSFFFYGRQALTWKEEEDVDVAVEEN